MNYTVCWKHRIAWDSEVKRGCLYCENERFRALSGKELVSEFWQLCEMSPVWRSDGKQITCGLCSTKRPLHHDRCPVCSEWEKASHSGSHEHPAPSREDAHMIRLLLRSSLGCVPGVKWSRF